MATISGWDILSWFKDGEDDKYLVEYILADDGGFCHRASPFLMSVGTVFEHNYGTYRVEEILRQKNHIVLYCNRITSKHDKFDKLHNIQERLN